jgi:hypothetical protein
MNNAQNGEVPTRLHYRRLTIADCLEKLFSYSKRVVRKSFLPDLFAHTKCGLHCEYSPGLWTTALKLMNNRMRNVNKC